MKVFIGADHRGFRMKEELVQWLAEAGHEVVDLGAEEYEKTDDYPDFAFKIAEAVVADAAAHGIAICGSGAGMAVAANKVTGARAVLVTDPAMAKPARSDDNCNILALAEDFTDFEVAKQIITTWLETDFLGEERHVRRLQKIGDYEQGNA